MDFKEFQLQVSENRRKVDFQNMENATNLHETREKNSLNSEPAFDLRKSLAWDSAFFNSPGVLDPEELFDTLNFKAADNGEPMSLLPSKSTEPARTSGIDSLRKSLAWDSAFFTSAGVLDAEELSVINRGFRRPEMALLPGVEEEIWRSTESNSTITSDGYSLANLELDLFDDIRASIRNSRDPSSNGTSSTCKLKREKGRQNGNVSRILDASSQVTHAASKGGSNSSSSRKPPRVSSRANPSPMLPSKRSSLSASHVKMDNRATKSFSADGKNMVMSKKMCLRESCIAISSSTPTLKSPSSVLPAGTNEFVRFCYASADFTGKSPSNPSVRTTDSCLATSGSRFQTPLKCSVGGKKESLNYNNSTPNSFLCTSPSCSIDGWSSESSSTSIKQRSNCSASPTNIPIREIIDRATIKASPSGRHHHSEPCSGHEIRETKFTNTQNNDITVSSSPAAANVSRKLRPSGLRMPSPKIGFFDAENSIGLAQNGGLRFNSGGSEFSSGAIKSNLSANRTRYGKHGSAGISTGPATKSGLKDEGKICSRERKQRVGRVHRRLGGCNKENENVVSFENEVDDLTRSMGAIGFRRN